MINLREREINPLDYWRVLVKRRWIVYAVLAVVVTTVTLSSLLTEPIYTATARLQIERSSPNVLPFQQVVGEPLDYHNDFYRTQYGLIQSRRVARDVVRSLRLERHPEFRVEVPEEAGQGTTPEQAVESTLVDRLLKDLDVEPVLGSRLVDVSFSAHDRRLATKLANRIAETYIDFNSRAQYNTSERASTSLTLQMANLQEEIEEKEKQLQAYATEHGIIPLNEKQNITLKHLNDLNDAYTRAQAERIEREAHYAALQIASPENVAEVFENDLIMSLSAATVELQGRYAELSEKYKPDWPQMVAIRRDLEETARRLEEERRTIYEQALGAARNDYQSAVNEEAYFKTALESLKRESQEQGLKEIEYDSLRLDIANRRSTFEALVRRQSETTTTAGMGEIATSNIRIVDSAEVPSRPSSPKIVRNVSLSIIVGLSLGILLAFLVEHLDKSVKTSEEMQHATGAPSIGHIPALRSEAGRLRLIGSDAGGKPPSSRDRVDLISHEDMRSEVAEAFREIRTALLVSRPGGPPRTILITSSNPSEGKTAAAMNLAVTLAQSGRKVLLVDADMRRPRLHKVLGLGDGEGVSSALSGLGSPRAKPQQTFIPGLDLLPSGPVPPNPADLLDSGSFDEMKGELEARGYDHIIFDSPPILAVADPVIMAGRMDAVVLVVWAGVTGRDALAHAARRLHQVKARVVGGILNRVEFDHHGYYSGYYYRGRYQDRGDSGESRTASSGGGERA